MIYLNYSKDKQFYFVVKGKNGQPVATSETYKTKAGARKGVKALVKIMSDFCGLVVDNTGKLKQVNKKPKR